MTDFEYKRIEYIINQASKGTYVALNRGDVDILSKLVKEYKDKFDWEDTLNKVKEELNEA